MVLSADGEILILGAPFEASLDPYDPTNNAGTRPGAVYSFDRTP